MKQRHPGAIISREHKADLRHAACAQRSAHRSGPGAGRPGGRCGLHRRDRATIGRGPRSVPNRARQGAARHGRGRSSPRSLACGRWVWRDAAVPRRQPGMDPKCWRPDRPGTGDRDQGGCGRLPLRLPPPVGAPRRPGQQDLVGRPTAQGRLGADHLGPPPRGISPGRLPAAAPGLFAWRDLPLHR
jgi:hypothetical protein